MPISENDNLGPGFEKRLRAALDSVVPPSPRLANARYRTSATWRPGRAWRLAPALIGVLAAGVALTAGAATDSPTNRALWLQRAQEVVQNVNHFPGTKETQKPRPAPSHANSQGTGTGHSTPSGDNESDGSKTPQPTDRAAATPRSHSTPTPDEEGSKGSDIQSSD
jgi:hypothetical protein